MSLAVRQFYDSLLLGLPRWWVDSATLGLRFNALLLKLKTWRDNYGY